jgi:hypothetical protein
MEGTNYAYARELHFKALLAAALAGLALQGLNYWWGHLQIGSRGWLRGPGDDKTWNETCLPAVLHCTNICRAPQLTIAFVLCRLLNVQNTNFAASGLLFCWRKPFRTMRTSHAPQRAIGIWIGRKQ